MRLLIWALAGGVIATALDALHVVTGTLVYTNPVFGLQDWWVAPQFALAGILVGEGHRRVAIPMARRSVPAATNRELALGIALFIGSYASSGFLKAWPNLASVLFVAMFLVGVVRAPADARPALLLHAVALAISGPLVEATISSTGLFHYLVPDVLGVPRWLPGIYLNVAVASAALDRRMMARA